MKQTKLASRISAALAIPATHDKLEKRIADAMAAGAMDHKHLWRYEVNGVSMGIAIAPDGEDGENMLGDGQTIVLEANKTLVMNPRTLERIRQAAPAGELACLHAQGDDEAGRCRTCGYHFPL
jgi:hypothetical protein